MKKQIEFGKKALGIKKSVKIEVIFKSDFAQEAYFEKTAKGYNVIINDRIAKKKFNPEYAMNKNLFHEMTHIAQYESGRLVKTESGIVWEGQFISHEDYRKNYYDMKFEHEAYDSERELADRFSAEKK